MSSEDQLRPYHAKDEARGQEAADAVAAVLKHAAERDKAAHTKTAPRKQPKWMLPLGINLAVLATYLLLAPPSWVTVNPIEGPDLAAQEENLRGAMWMLAQRVDAYRIQNGQAPADLSAVGSSYPGIDYVRQGTGNFQLVATLGEIALVYDSAQPDPSFAQAAAARMAGG